ncbi:MAG: proline--tRNA ligase [Candidatus Bipolaricaulota bacterium]|nr:MAG: proline--tRNA ligase [Candidatus Bipolaricaulota bacterium]
MARQGVTPRSEDYARWYTEVVQMAELADYAPVRGCMIIRPYGYELWEAVKAGLDRRFKETGHRNAYFPLFIPMSFIQKEAEHVEGFAPELAVVTHGGGKELEEPLVVRPTSETIIGHAFASWVQSHRDLPLLINQWANVVRWEMRPRLFLRTTEFLWQEGHTAHATAEEAMEETLRILDIYADFAERDAAVPVIKGRKSAQEKFAGAADSYTIEAMMGNFWALQAGTSHFLAQNFARAFDITYLDASNQLEHCWTTSWGVSSRMVGGIVMAHGDDGGLRLPPVVAPIQAVIVPIWRSDDDRGVVLEAAHRVTETLRADGVRVHLDEREGLTPGFKFNDWEMRGVPLRIEIGPRDVAAESVVLVRRDRDGKEAKSAASVTAIEDRVRDLLDAVQQSLLQQAAEFRDAHLHEASSLDELRDIVSTGWALIPHCGTKECELSVKEETKATSRCFPLDRNPEWNPSGLSCGVCERPALGYAYFARAY